MAASHHPVHQYGGTSGAGPGSGSTFPTQGMNPFTSASQGLQQQHPLLLGSYMTGQVSPGIPPNNQTAPHHMLFGRGLPGFGVHLHSGTTSVAPVGGDLLRCHMHSKPSLHCKFCRKFKTVAHHHARLAHLQGSHALQMFPKAEALDVTNSVTYNLNPLLRENILASEYYKSLYQLHTYRDVMEEIRQYADHAEPYCSGNTRAPSTFFCCMYKLLSFQITKDEMFNILDDENVFVRVSGFLWLRFVHPPDKLWEWFEPFLLDDVPFSPSADRNNPTETTLGEFLESLILEDRYFSTVLPRLPAKTRTAYGIQLMSLPEHRRRKKRNKRNVWKFKPGVQVLACYKSKWRMGVLEDLYEDDDRGSGTLALVKFDEDEAEPNVEGLELEVLANAIPIDLGLVIVLTNRHMRKLEALKYKGEASDPNSLSAEEEEDNLLLLTSSGNSGGDNPDDIEHINKKIRLEDGKAHHHHTDGTSDKGGGSTDDHSYHLQYSRGGTSSSFPDSSSGSPHHRFRKSKSPSSKHDRREGGGGYGSSSTRQTINSSDSQPLTTDRYEKLTSNSDGSWAQQYKQRERDRALAEGKDYAKRPSSYKASLSVKLGHGAKQIGEKMEPTMVEVHSLGTAASNKNQPKKNAVSLEHQERIASLASKYSSHLTNLSDNNVD